MHTMAECFGKRKASRQTTSRIVALAWRIEKLKSFFTGKAPLVTKESAKVAHSMTHFENEKFLRAFPEFRFTPLEDSIKHACDQYKKYHSNQRQGEKPIES